MLNQEKTLNEIIKKVEKKYYNNELIEAEKYANDAYHFCIKTYGFRHKKTAEALSDKALFLDYRKEFENSRKAYLKAIQINQSLIEADIITLAAFYNGLSHVYKSIGDYSNCLKYFQKAALIAESLKDDTLGTHYCDLARIQKITNKIEEAIQTYKKSISISRNMILNTRKENHKYYEQIIYNCYNDLSEIELTKGELHQAKQYHLKAIQVLENSKSDLSTFFEAYKRFEIPAKMLVYQKIYEQAIHLFKKAKTAIIEEYKGFEVGKDLANIIHQIGECYAALNQNNNALQTYQDAINAICNNFQPASVKDLPEIEQIYNKRSAVASLSYKADAWLRLYNEQQKHNCLLQAFQTYQLIATLLPVTRRDYVEENSKFQLADETKGIYEKTIDTCLRLHQKSADKKYLQAAFQFSESSKAIVLQEKLQADFALTGMEESVQQKDIDYRSKIAFYQNAINTSKATKGDSNQIENWESNLWKCKEDYERFQQKIEIENPNYYQVKYAQSLTSISNLQDKLPADTALIKYFTGADNLYFFVVTKTYYKVHKAEMSSKQLASDIESFKKLIHNFNRSRQVEADYENYRKLGYSLYQKLLEKTLQDLEQPVNRLIIIPDGLLYHIPFEALLTSESYHNPSLYYHPDNLDYLCKQYALSHYYSASLVANIPDQKSQSHKRVFTAIAPVVKDLNHNKEEVIQISKLLKGKTLLGKAASLENFQKIATENQIVHLATHAKCNEIHSQMSYIQFQNDNNLDIKSIENMKVFADLVVLSACETGYGVVQSGEGAMSLARSFYLAGCPSLVASLWRANDQSTAKLMLYFYQYLKDGVTKDIALQKAKLKYCDEAGLRESHPFYWAGFVQFGNRKSLF